MKRLLGILLILAGTGGIGLSILGGLYAWRAKQWLAANVPAHLKTAEVALGSLSAELQNTRSELERMDARLAEVQSGLEKVARDRDERAVPPVLQQAIEKNIVVPLRNLEELTLSTQHTMHSLSNALLVMDTVPLFAMGRGARPSGGERPLQSVAASLQEAAGLLDEIVQMMASIRSLHELSPQQLSRANSAMGTARRHFQFIRQQADVLAGRVQNAQATASSAHRRAGRWLTRGSILAISICVAFGCSQLGVVRHGLQWACSGPA